MRDHDGGVRVEKIYPCHVLWQLGQLVEVWRSAGGSPKSCRSLAVRYRGIDKTRLYLHSLNGSNPTFAVKARTFLELTRLTVFRFFL